MVVDLICIGNIMIDNNTIIKNSFGAIYEKFVFSYHIILCQLFNKYGVLKNVKYIFRFYEK